MRQFEDLDKRLALLEQKLDLVLNNHLHHMEKDLNLVKKIMITIAVAVLTEALYIIVKFGM